MELPLTGNSLHFVVQSAHPVSYWKNTDVLCNVVESFACISFIESSAWQPVLRHTLSDIYLGGYLRFSLRLPSFTRFWNPFAYQSVVYTGALLSSFQGSFRHFRGDINPSTHTFLFHCWGMGYTGILISICTLCGLCRLCRMSLQCPLDNDWSELDITMYIYQICKGCIL